MSAKIRRLRERLASATGLDDDERDDYEDMLDEAEDAQSGGSDIGAALDRFARSLDRAIGRTTAPEGGSAKPPARKSSGGDGGGKPAARQARKSSWFGS